MPRPKKDQPPIPPPPAPPDSDELSGVVVFICERYPEIRIGPSIKFDGGVFTTKDKDEIRAIQGSDSFKGGFIVATKPATPERQKLPVIITTGPAERPVVE